MFEKSGAGSLQYQALQSVSLKQFFEGQPLQVLVAASQPESSKSWLVSQSRLVSQKDEQPSMV